MSNGFASPAALDKRSSQGKGLRPAIDAEEVQQQWLASLNRCKTPEVCKDKCTPFSALS